MPFAQASVTTLSIKGAPANWRTLNIKGPTEINASPTLMMAAPPSQTTTLVAGRTYYASGDITLSINGSIGGSAIEGASDDQGTTTLAFTRVPSAEEDQTFNLVLSAQRIGSGIGVTPLAMLVPEMPVDSGNATIFISGATISAPGDDNNNIGLVVKNFEMNNNNITLYMDKDFNFSDTTTLQIKSRISSGFATLSTDGAYGHTDTTTLMIKPPTSGVIPLNVFGYSE